MKSLLARLLLVMLALLVPLSAALAQDDEEEESGGKPFIKPPANARPEREHHDGITTSVWTFQPQDESSSAKGTARVMCYSDDKDQFRMDLHGIKPNSVYTVWFVTSLRSGSERSGIGNEPFSFKTGGGGHVLYQAPLKSCPLIKFKWVEVRIHPDGNPKNVENSVRVLKAHMIAE